MYHNVSILLYIIEIVYSQTKRIAQSEIELPGN